MSGGKHLKNLLKQIYAKDLESSINYIALKSSQTKPLGPEL